MYQMDPKLKEELLSLADEMGDALTDNPIATGKTIILLRHLAINMEVVPKQPTQHMITTGAKFLRTTNPLPAHKLAKQLWETMWVAAHQETKTEPGG